MKMALVWTDAKKKKGRIEGRKKKKKKKGLGEFGVLWEKNLK